MSTRVLLLLLVPLAVGCRVDTGPTVAGRNLHELNELRYYAPDPVQELVDEAAPARPAQVDPANQTGEANPAQRVDDSQQAKLNTAIDL